MAGSKFYVGGIPFIFNTLHNKTTVRNVKKNRLSPYVSEMCVLLQPKTKDKVFRSSLKYWLCRIDKLMIKSAAARVGTKL